MDYLQILSQVKLHGYGPIACVVYSPSRKHLHIMYEVDHRAKRQNTLRALRDGEDEESVLIQEIFCSKDYGRIAMRKSETDDGIRFCCRVENGFIIGTRTNQLYFERTI